MLADRSFYRRTVCVYRSKVYTSDTLRNSRLSTSMLETLGSSGTYSSTTIVDNSSSSSNYSGSSGVNVDDITYTGNGASGKFGST